MKSQAKTLLDYYSKKYLAAYREKPVINFYRERWGMEEIAKSVGVVGAKELIDYYFTLTKWHHPLDYFYRNYDKLLETMELRRRDKERRDKLMRNTEELVKKRYG